MQINSETERYQLGYANNVDVTAKNEIRKDLFKNVISDDIKKRDKLKVRSKGSQQKEVGKGKTTKATLVSHGKVCSCILSQIVTFSSSKIF